MNLLAISSSISLVITLALGWSLFLFPRFMRYVGTILKRTHKRDTTFEPWVSLFIPAYNEADVIERKIMNALNLEYPKDKLEIIVCSDSSNDGTNEIVARLAQEHKQITFRNFSQRSGKTGMINSALPQARGEIIILTDANTMFMPTVVRKLTSSFYCDTIGAVLGRVDLFVPHGYKGMDKEVSYRLFESKIKRVEGLFGLSMGAFGGLYAIRKKDFVPLPKNAYSNDDFLIPSLIACSGKQVVFDWDAISKEETGISITEEFGRRVRIGAGNFQSVTFAPQLLNPLHPLRLLFYVSHKLIRWFLPFLLFALYFSTMYAAFFIDEARLYFALQTLLYIGAFVGFILNSFGKPLGFFQSAYHFLSMSIAISLGFFRFAKGIKSATWSSIERSVD